MLGRFVCDGCFADVNFDWDDPETFKQARERFRRIAKQKFHYCDSCRGEMGGDPIAGDFVAEKHRCRPE